MNKNLSKIYTLVVILALILLGAWSAWDVYQLRSVNTKAAQLNIDTIKNTVEESYNSEKSFKDSEFFNVIKSLFSENQELELITIYSHDTGIEYYYNRGDEVTLLNQDEENPLTWESLPEYKYNQLLKTRLVSSISATDRTGLDMDLIYQVVDKTTVYEILIRLLIVVVVLFFTTLLMIFVVSRKQLMTPAVDSDDDDENEDFDENSSTEDEMSLDWEEKGFDLPNEDLNLEDDLDFSDLELDKTDDDFSELSLNEDSDFGDLNLEDMDDVSFDEIETDFPEEEDLLAMDHELSPSSEMDNFDFDDIGDSFSDELTDSISDDETKSLYSPKSGVGWEDFIEERVNLELERAASFDQDLVMGIIQCKSLTEDNYRIFADELKNDFNYPDMIFEYKDNGFAIIVPNTDLDKALQTLETFTGKEETQYGLINVGISSRNGRLISGSRIFMESENALHKAINDSEKNIVGFRSDPDKFRDYLSQKK